jgi:molybdate transport system permease protein
MQWHEANVVAAGMAIFSFIVILTMTLLQKRMARVGE